jgi:glycosyltransferase involved in cell wall biosynthesis
LPGSPPLASALDDINVVHLSGADATGRPERPSPSLLVPANDVADPILSIVIPAMNEEITVGDFVAWCRAGLEDAGVAGEILIVDSSTDRTPELAVAAGARVLRVPQRGLGRAYIDALPFIRGRWVIMGDADCTYDFRQLAPFTARFDQGFEFVMGSRWKGAIETGSMPALHRYLGTPITTLILNTLFGSRFSDIHCGMRGITRDALERMHLQSQSWEYASEMVLKSVHMHLRTTEVPVSFLKDRQGRVSHHKRLGWFSPFQAAWINLRAMFIYGADFFLLKPGLLLTVLGLLIVVPLTFGPITIGPLVLSLYWMLFGLTMTVLGLQSFYMGCIVQVLHDYTGGATRRWLSVFRYTRTMLIAAAMFIVGIGLAVGLIVDYIGSGLRLPLSHTHQVYFAVTGLLLVITSFMTFAATLLVHAAALRGPRAGVAGDELT